MKLLLVDGHYYVYRSFFAIRELSNSRGEPTNAIYGFVKTLRRMVKDLAPDRGAVVWDEGLPARRTELQPAYKQHRAEMPVEMRPQLDFIRKLVPLLGFQSISAPDTEADDLMASYALAATQRQMEVVLATNDKDLFQLVDGGIRVYTTNKADLATPKDTFALLDEASVLKKWGVPPPRIGDVIALIGDTVDNIPGVAGLGPKNAAHLLKTHGTLDALLADLSVVENARIREKLQGAREQIIQNREMVRLDIDLPLPVALDSLEIVPKHDELIATLERCEFKSLMAEIQAEAEATKVKSAGMQGELF
ncbi:MAG TPA: 5'-3' exonuclease H3TH domain-containing protein [Chthoniobacteraceae bacterium]|jgi:DNA polymerase-1|nr:5'-3' exonuclease H3TH domain-containing protein [Chthoniobacteraceae bacterium]